MNNDLFTEKNKEEVIEIIGDALSEELKRQDNLQAAEVYQAAIDICTLLSGSAIFAGMAFEVWSITHPRIVRDIRKRAKINGIDLKDQIIEDILHKIGEYLGFIYPPFDEEGNSL